MPLKEEEILQPMDGSRRTYLLTGGTGFLGLRLARALLERGDRVIFLGRRKHRESLAERICKQLITLDRSLTARSFATLEVDLGKPDLGLLPTTVESLAGAGICGIWHAAANLSFEDCDRREVFTTNLLGTRNVLALSERIGSRLYHISTAYVHGNRRGRILETDLIRPRRFNNTYEESKFEAEELLRSEGSAQKFVIFRPSILVGTGTAEKIAATGYYAVLDGFRQCKVLLRRQKLRDRTTRRDSPRFPFPLLCSRSARLNLMPSDVATTLMLQIADHPASVGETFHITNPDPFSMVQAFRQTLEAVALDGTVIGAPRWITRLYLSALTHTGLFTSRLPVVFVKRLALYKSYMVQENIYDMQNTGRIVGESLATMFGFNTDFVKERAAEFLANLNSERASTRGVTRYEPQRSPATAGTNLLRDA